MRISIIVPTHNEEKYLPDCLDSFVRQTLTVDELIIVDDNSTDGTFKIAKEYSRKHSWIKVVQHRSSISHSPGSKVVRAFNFGLQHTTNYDLVGKFDADIVLPNDYFEIMLNRFQADWKLGISSGLLYVQRNGKWIYENIANKNHVRGPIKLYFKSCFNAIGGLREGTGWDTVDTLLARYHNFHVRTDQSLKVKHLRPTGKDYSRKKYTAKGKALYKMRYDIVLAELTALKMAWQTKNPLMYFGVVFGYIGAFLTGSDFFVSKKEGRFIRKYRWKGVLKKLF